MMPLLVAVLVVGLLVGSVVAAAHVSELALAAASAFVLVVASLATCGATCAWLLREGRQLGEYISASHAPRRP